MGVASAEVSTGNDGPAVGSGGGDVDVGGPHGFSTGPLNDIADTLPADAQPSGVCADDTALLLVKVC